MRILHVITSLWTGGAEHLMVDLLPELRRMGNEVELLVFDGTDTPFKRQLEAEGVKITSLSVGGSVYNPLNVLKLVRHMRSFDIVHTHNTACQLFAAMAGVLCSAVLCTTEHTTSNRRRDWRWYAPIDRWMYRQYDAIVCISGQAEANLRSSLGRGNWPIRTIYNGIKVERYASAKPDVRLVAEKGCRKAVAMVAAFRYQKDQDTLVRAMRLLPADKYELWLVGDGERRGDVEKLAHEEGVDARVKFLGIRTDVPEVLKAADVVVLSSHFEGLPLSGIEGMASGRPFVASDVDGLHEIVAGSGVLFPHGDAKALAGDIERLCENAAESEAVAQRCQAKAREFDISVMAQKYDEVYRSLQ